MAYTVRPVKKRSTSNTVVRARKGARAAGSSPAAPAELRALAALHGVSPAFIDSSGVRRAAGPESMRRVLAVLGVPADSGPEARESLRQAHRANAERAIEPVMVAWLGRQNSVMFRAPGSAGDDVECVLTRDDGTETRWSGAPRAVARPPARFRGAKGERVPPVRTVRLPRDLPMGYHRLTIRSTGGKRAKGWSLETLVMAAPVASWTPEAETEKLWGLFCPMYALRSSRNLGVGDTSDFRELARWAGSMGARVFATLPLLASFLDEPFDPSPYAPVSRLFWNELFADVMRAPELESSAAAPARELLRSAGFRREAAELRATPRVDYRRCADLQRRVLDELSRAFTASGGEGGDAFKRFVAENPELERYARFRAVGERHKASWGNWPGKASAGVIRDGDYDPEVAQRHMYAQFLVSMQVAELADELRERGALPYLDLPVGVHPSGYDTWRWRETFALGASTGAPPDPYFAAGQNWGFAPMHPERVRLDGYGYFVRSLRHHMKLASCLRIDHVMMLHRLFWIPSGMTAADGVYVQYHADELWAALMIESHRARCRVIGENLGTVPKVVNERMVKHGVGQLYVGQYELNPSARTPLRDPPANCAASVNTHDMPQFAHYWAGGDIGDRVALDMLAPAEEPAETVGREAARKSLVKFLTARGLLGSAADPKEPGAVLRAVLRFLAASDAGLVLINLEDLWDETHWQNIPGTYHEHPNWRHKLARTFDELRADPELNAFLREIDALRRSSPPPKPPGRAGTRKRRPRVLTPA